jgi:hypothetical protein
MRLLERHFSCSLFLTRNLPRAREGKIPLGRVVRATLLVSAVLLVGLSGYDLSRSLSSDYGSPDCSSAWSHSMWPMYLMFNADAVTPAVAYEDWVTNRYSPSATYYSAHTFWFPDYLVYFACRALTGATASAVVLCGAVQFALLVAAFWLLGEAVFGSRARWARTVVLLVLASAYVLVTSLTLTKGRLGEGYALAQMITMLHVFMMQYHTGAFLVTIAALALLLFALRDWDRPWRRSFWLLGVFVLAAPGVASDRLLSLWLIAPAEAVLVLAWIYGRRDGAAALVSLRAAFGAGAVLAAAWLTGNVLLQWQASNRVVRLDHFLQLQASAIRSSWETLRKTPEVFRHGNVLPWACAAWLLLCLSAAAVSLRRRTAAEGRMPRTLVFVVWFYLILSAGNLAAAILTGQLASPFGSFRYMLPVFLVPVLGWALWLPVACRSGRAQAGVAAALLTGGALLWAVAWRQPRSGEFLVWDYYPPEVRRLDALAEKYGLTDGIAAFWQSKPYSLLSRRRLRLVQVVCSDKFPGWQPSLELNSKDSYLGGHGPTAPGRAYNFLLLDSRLPSAVIPALPPLEQLVAMFGEPAALIALNPWERVAIYNRPTDTAFRDWALHCRLLNPDAVPTLSCPSLVSSRRTLRAEVRREQVPDRVPREGLDPADIPVPGTP